MPDRYYLGYAEGGRSRDADYQAVLSEDRRFNWPDDRDATPEAVADFVTEALADAFEQGREAGLTDACGGIVPNPYRKEAGP